MSLHNLIDKRRGYVYSKLNQYLHRLLRLPVLQVAFPQQPVHVCLP